jgi:hypothetical protein
MPPEPPPLVAAVLASYPAAVQPGLQRLRQMIFDQAAGLPQIGPLTEALRWGQPAYLTLATGAGSPLRIGVPKAGGFALYAQCQTTLIADLAAMAGTALRYEGNRAVLFDVVEDILADPVCMMIRRALTWHLAARRKAVPAVAG